MLITIDDQKVGQNNLPMLSKKGKETTNTYAVFSGGSKSKKQIPVYEKVDEASSSDESFTKEEEKYNLPMGVKNPNKSLKNKMK